MQSTESKYGYRFIRLAWDNATRLSEQLASEMAENEEVAHMSTTDDEILVLVRYPLE